MIKKYISTIMRRSHSSYFKQTGGSYEALPTGQVKGISPANSMFFGTMKNGMMHGTNLHYSWDGDTHNERNVAIASFEHGQVHGPGRVTSSVCNDIVTVTAEGTVNMNQIETLTWKVEINYPEFTQSDKRIIDNPGYRVDHFKTHFNTLKMFYVKLALEEANKTYRATQAKKVMGTSLQLEEQKRAVLETTHLAKDIASKRKKTGHGPTTKSSAFALHNGL